MLFKIQNVLFKKLKLSFKYREVSREFYKEWSSPVNDGRCNSVRTMVFALTNLFTRTGGFLVYNFL